MIRILALIVCALVMTGCGGGSVYSLQGGEYVISYNGGIYRKRPDGYWELVGEAGFGSTTIQRERIAREGVRTGRISDEELLRDRPRSPREGVRRNDIADFLANQDKGGGGD